MTLLKEAHSDELVVAIAAEVLEALDHKRQITPITERVPQFDLETAYKVAARVRELREARGEKAVGRKLGFTNSGIWAEYGVYAPIWGYVYDTTVVDVDPRHHDFDISAVVEPRIEPEISLSFRDPPSADMTEFEIFECVDWVAHGFEVVQSIFPQWHFKAPDTVAAFGLHGALMLGPRHEITKANIDKWFRDMTNFRLVLMRNGIVIDKGEAKNVLGGPLSALRHAIGAIARDSRNPAVGAGEIVTTGTITRAFPMTPSETWETSFSGIEFEGHRLRLS